MYIRRFCGAEGAATVSVGRVMLILALLIGVHLLEPAGSPLETIDEVACWCIFRAVVRFGSFAYIMFDFFLSLSFQRSASLLGAIGGVLSLVIDALLE